VYIGSTNCKYIRFQEIKELSLLPIRLLQKEKKDFYITQNRNREIMLGPKRKLFLDDYVQEVRTNLHEQRAIEKREKLNAQIAA
jgi:hypothetical protein